MRHEFPITGHRFLFDFGETAKYELHFVAEDKLDVTVVADASYPAGTLNHFTITRSELRPDLYMVT